MTSGDLTFDLLKNDRSSFVMIFDALSNAAYRVSLRGPGAELDGGVQTSPAGGRSNTHRPARSAPNTAPARVNNAETI